MKGEVEDALDLSGSLPLTMLIELGISNVSRDLSTIFYGELVGAFDLSVEVKIKLLCGVLVKALALQSWVSSSMMIRPKALSVVICVITVSGQNQY